MSNQLTLVLIFRASFVCNSSGTGSKIVRKIGGELYTKILPTFVKPDSMKNRYHVNTPTSFSYDDLPTRQFAFMTFRILLFCLR